MYDILEIIFKIIDSEFEKIIDRFVGGTVKEFLQVFVDFIEFSIDRCFYLRLEQGRKIIGEFHEFSIGLIPRIEHKMLIFGGKFIFSNVGKKIFIDKFFFNSYEERFESVDGFFGRCNDISGDCFRNVMKECYHHHIRYLLSALPFYISDYIGNKRSYEQMRHNRYRVSASHTIPTIARLESSHTQEKSFQIILFFWIQVNIFTEDIKSRLAHLLLDDIHSRSINVEIYFVAEICFVIRCPQLGKSNKIVFFRMNMICSSLFVVDSLHIRLHPIGKLP